MAHILDETAARTIIKDAILKISNNDVKFFRGILSNSDVDKKCEKALKIFIKNAKENPTTALYFLVLAVNCGNQFIIESYKKNIFKPSMFDYKCPKHFYLYVEYILKEMDLDDELKVYIKSVLNIISIQDELLKEYEFIVNTIKSKGKKFLKTILAWSEFVFLQNANVMLANKTILSKEVLAEACSYLVAIYFHILPSESYHQEDIDIDDYKTYLPLIEKAISIKKYIYAEISIGKLPYEVVKNGKSIKFKAISDRYERCRCAGFTVHELKSAEVFAAYKGEKHYQDFIDMLSENADDLSEKLVDRLENPERFALRLYVDDDNFMKKMFDHDGLFRDDIAALMYICTQFHIQMPKLLEFKLAKKLSVNEFIKIKRFFTFISIIFGHGLKKKFNENEDIAIILRSIIGGFNLQVQHPQS